MNYSLFSHFNCWYHFAIITCNISLVYVIGNFIPQSANDLILIWCYMTTNVYISSTHLEFAEQILWSQICCVLKLWHPKLWLILFFYSDCHLFYPNCWLLQISNVCCEHFLVYMSVLFRVTLVNTCMCKMTRMNWLYMFDLIYRLFWSD